MNARTSLIQEFYGCLVLLRLLTPNRLRVSSDGSIDRAGPKRNEWHVFLDNLAWLADHKRGGKTVTAIAVEPSLAGPIYWIASNSLMDPKALQHMEKLLSDLYHETSLDQLGPIDLIRKIARSSIELSGIRVRDYGQKLKGTIAAIDAREPVKRLEVSERQHLEDFLDLSRDPDRLIDLSMKLKRSRLVKRISLLIQVSEEQDLWKQVRHLLGRLCSWVRAAHYLVLTCERFRDRIKDARVRPVTISIGATKLELPWRKPLDILRTVMPEFHNSLLQDALHVRQNDQVVDRILLCLSKMASGEFESDLHAEVILLLHFHEHQLEFIAGDRYIGCSKPSCYCCDLYLRSHPAGVRPRRSHGNVWIAWGTPKLHADLTPGEAKALEDVVSTVKLDLRYQIMSGPSLARRSPDSTTGLGSTEPCL